MAENKRGIGFAFVEIQWQIQPAVNAYPVAVHAVDNHGVILAGGGIAFIGFPACRQRFSRYT